MPSKSPLSAILQGRCPCCREGKMFKTGTIDIHFAEMNVTCPKCGVSLTPEPGFYIGAMYISYAFNIILLVTIGVTLYTFTEAPDWVYITSIIGASFVFIPFSFRYSRIIFLHAFGGLKYQGDESI
jgi:uncharacterized protein (DUF983 family)